MKKYKAAIYLPTYNRPYSLMDAVYSAVSQSAEFPYLLWIYDNSTKEDDSTRELLKALNSPKIQVVTVDREKDVNYYVKGFNQFIDEVDAEYFFNMQDDDTLDKDFLKLMVEALDSGKKAVYCGREHTHINGSVETYTHGQVFSSSNTAAGNLETTMIGVKREVTPKLLDFEIGNMAGIVTMMHSFLKGIESQTNIHPVLEGEVAKTLYFQRTFPNSSWQSY